MFTHIIQQHDLGALQKLFPDTGPEIERDKRRVKSLLPWQALILTVADGDFVLKMVSRILPKNPCESKTAPDIVKLP